MKCARLLAPVLLALAAPQDARSYEVLGPVWPTPTATLHVDIPDANDPWNGAFEEAMAEWGQSGDFSYQIVHALADPCSDPNINPPISGVAFRVDNCEMAAFQPGTLALTIVWAVPSPGPMPDDIVQAGVVFNDNVNFAVYEGPGVSNPRDYRRVAVHELGHAIGLDHTTAPSIMQASVADIEVPQIDDFDGVANLYGSGTAAGVLSVAQRADFAAAGDVGGPFEPNSPPTYTASNNGEVDLAFQVTADVSWLDVPSGSLVLPGDPNANSVEVAISFGPSAMLLGVGVHVGTLSFVNLTSGNGNTTRRVELSLQLPDMDGDGVPDATDNCVSVANASQTNSDLPLAGDACQCSDIDADAGSDIVDAVLMERFRMGLSLPAGLDGTRCAVDAGLTPCGQAGIVAMRQTLAEAGSALVESCPGS